MSEDRVPRPSLLDRPIRQIALVVADLEVAVRAYADAGVSLVGPTFAKILD